jgi:hypothetical protein
MAKAAGVLAAVDPNLNARVSEATSKLPIERGLDTIAKANHAQWRKVYLSAAAVPYSADGSVDARRLIRLIEGVAALKSADIGVVDPATGQMTVASRAPESSPAMREYAKTRKAVYLLYLPGAVTAQSDGSGNMLPPGGIEALNAMTPEQRAQWMKDHGGVIVTSDMSPDERTQALQNVPPDERARIQEKMDEAAKNGAKSVTIIQRQTSPS